MQYHRFRCRVYLCCPGIGRLFRCWAGPCHEICYDWLIYCICFRNYIYSTSNPAYFIVGISALMSTYISAWLHWICLSSVLFIIDLRVDAGPCLLQWSDAVAILSAIGSPVEHLRQHHVAVARQGPGVWQGFWGFFHSHTLVYIPELLLEITWAATTLDTNIALQDYIEYEPPK